jgi:hypothetical protein
MMRMLTGARAANRGCSVRCPQRIGVSVAKRGVLSAETADATTRELRAIDVDDFTGIRPILGGSDQPGTHRIFANVAPFFAIRLIAPEQAIEKPRLPKRSQLLARNRQRLVTRSGERTVQVPLQSVDPITERNFTSSTEAHEQVYVIRHDDIPANADALFTSSPAVLGKTAMKVRGRKEVAASVSVEGDKEQRRIVFPKYSLEPRRLTLALLLHGRGCSVRCPQRTSLHVSDTVGPLGTADATTSTLTSGAKAAIHS